MTAHKVTVHGCACVWGRRIRVNTHSLGHLSWPGPGLDNAVSVMEERALVHLHTHTHIHSHGFPGLERGWIGIWAMQAFWILSVSRSPSLLIQTSQGAHSWPPCHTCVTLLSHKTCRSTLLVSGHRADQIPTAVVHMPAHVHIHSKHGLRFTPPISTSSTLVPLKILCRDCFLLFSKGQDMVRWSTLWPLCLLWRSQEKRHCFHCCLLPAYLLSVPERHLKASQVALRKPQTTALSSFNCLSFLSNTLLA